jgi:hypothetical protein
MSLRAMEEELFAEWRAKRPGFVADGVVAEDAYLQSEQKLLFILKEVNDPDGGDWDLREYLRNGGRSQTWNNITRWVEGIRRPSDDIPWSDLAEIDEERRRETLRSIAAVNLKKTPGGHTTDSPVLAKIAEQDKALLKRQLMLYDPDLIVCCGTSDTFHWLVSLEDEPQWKCTRRGVWFHEHKPGKYVVAYSHPLLYYGLVDAMREISM